MSVWAFVMEVIQMDYLVQLGLSKIRIEFRLIQETFRIIWALDLELWYLRSLKFVIALKFLGPKLFMLKNMVSYRSHLSINQFEYSF